VTQLPGDGAVLALFERLALDAGRVIMDIFHAGVGFETKADSSPVTEADRAAERVILAGLRDELKGIACVAEEEVSAGVLPILDDGVFLLVDPLDGTKEFIKRGTDFTVNIALVRDGAPEIGVVYAPARAALYAGRPGEAFEVETDRNFRPGRRSRMRTVHPGNRVRIVASRSHRTPETDDFIACYDGAEVVSVGSSLKFCLVARGEADLYPRFGRTMQWDTAAGDAVLRAAGGETCLVGGEPLDYGRRMVSGEWSFENPWFIATGSRELVRKTTVRCELSRRQ
jgi:3'(2'), 5'-bisphosphate nucleotidase